MLLCSSGAVDWTGCCQSESNLVHWRCSTYCTAWSRLTARTHRPSFMSTETLARSVKTGWSGSHVFFLALHCDQKSMQTHTTQHKNKKIFLTLNLTSGRNATHEKRCEPVFKITNHNIVSQEENFDATSNFFVFSLRL